MARSSGTKAIAERIVRAEDDFTGLLMSMGDVDRSAAERVLAYYRRHKIVKMDAVIGRMTVKDGIFLDKAVIQRAASL